MNQLLCIVGSTATGKTKRAIEESQKTPSILVSADSRQVYRGMDIVTGKDHPKDLLFYGIDIVNPDEDCSVSVWHDTVISHINQAWLDNKQVIVVGGTGLYVKAITDGIKTMSIPINHSLRDELSTLSVLALQSKLRELDPSKLSSMNNSDANNPRRLVRAIEIASSKIVPSPINQSIEAKIIGLKYFAAGVQRKKITERVLSRLGDGAIQETKKLLRDYNPSLKSMTAIGYRSIISHLNGNLSYDQLVESWVGDEMAYVKRQLTWFNKVKSIEWYDTTIVED